LADVLFGDYNPGGRLPVTFYKSIDQLPPFNDYDMKGKTYRFLTAETLYPFGYGLSYTTFAYRRLASTGDVRAGDDAKLMVEVQNTGKAAGEEVVQAYLQEGSGAQGGTVRSLAAFQRIALRPGERRKVELTLAARAFSHAGKDGRRTVEPALWEVSVGGKQPGFRGPADAATTGVVTGTIRITGPAKTLN